MRLSHGWLRTSVKYSGNVLCIVNNAITQSTEGLHYNWEVIGEYCLNN